MIFNTVEDKSFHPEFFNGSEVESESVIESIYNNVLLASTNFLAHSIKARPPKSRSYTDGWLKFKTEPTQIDPKFFGIQETKRKFDRSSINYKRQIVQALAYYFLFENTDCKVLIVNSERYYDYISIDDNQDFIEEVKPYILHALEQGSPCAIGKYCVLGNIRHEKTDFERECDIPSSIWAKLDKRTHDILDENENVSDVIKEIYIKYGN